jgi:AAA+ superfamily predicted ATPase
MPAASGAAATSIAGAAGLSHEWARIARLIAMAEAARRDLEFDDAFADAFGETSESVRQARAAGAWRGLARAAPREMLARLNSFDLDLLALALVPDAVPALGPRLQALQPHLSSPYPGLPLLQELLLLEAEPEIDRLVARLGPASPLMAAALLVIERAGDYQQVRPGPGVAQAVLGRAPDLGPPPGAHAVATRARLQDIVATPSQREALAELLAWVRGRSTVFGDWGGRALGGPLALFAGPSGVGKTFAATAIAGELGWPLYALDLGRVMSKYIGETEKNLNRLLDSLHGRPAVLQVDEADALLGKRGEITDARDRYANLEVSHLLSRLERHDGPVILTTNLRGNLDHAFTRRFHVVVDFPSPDAAMRARLWRTLLPKRAPCAGDVDPDLLGASVALSGGAIHNAAIRAAVLAAAEGGPIDLARLTRAIWRELAKENRQVRRSELGPLAAHLRGEGDQG